MSNKVTSARIQNAIETIEAQMRVLRMIAEGLSVKEDTSPLLRIDDVADRLSVSRSMAWKLVASGDLRSVRIGRTVRVRVADLEEFEASR